MDTPKKSSYKNSERFLLKANKRKAALRLDRIFFLKHLDIKNLTPFIRKTCTCAKFCKLKTNVKIQCDRILLDQPDQSFGWMGWGG